MKKALDFIKKNWLVLELIAVCFLVSIEVVGTWLCWAGIFIPLMVWIAVPIFKKKDL